MSKYALIDVANLFFRAKHAVRGDAYTKSGMVLHLLFRSMRKLVRDQGCQHVVLCLEGGSSWRTDVFPGYKSKRKLLRAKAQLDEREREEDEILFQILEDFVNFSAEKTNMTVLRSPSIEGDDFVARWIQLHPDDEHVIMSGDSDFVQLLAPNVSIYDGMEDRLLTPEGIFDDKGEPLVFNVDPKKGKIKVVGGLKEAQKKHRAEEKAKRDKNPTYEIKPFEWKIEEEWWKKALFIKLIRGDDSDSIPSCYPGVRYEGTSTSVGIREAWEDRNGKGLKWNNFFLKTFEKATHQKGQPVLETVKVRDEYTFNQQLVDLTQQPDDIKALMDEVILQAVQKERVANVGIHFLKFCSTHELTNLGKEAAEHARYLNTTYAGVQ